MINIENNFVKINAPTYGSEFNIDDIEEVTMLDRLPSGIRTNGVGASTYDLGNFSIDGYGKCKLYLYFENPNCISIKLKYGRYIFFNSKSNDETLRYYAELQKLLEPNYRTQLLEQYDILETKLGGIGASEKTAQLIVQNLNSAIS